MSTAVVSPVHVDADLSIVVGILLGGGGYAAREGSRAAAGPGLITFLVVVAGAILLFTNRYPQRLFDLIVGLNRWVLRVAAYASLMTDTYPPFALDQGGHEEPPPIVVAER